MNQPVTFDSLLKVLAYLKADGWKVSKSTLYNHRRQGRIKPDSDGHYPLKSVLRYANAHLPRQTTLKRLADEELQRRKAEAELEKIEEQTRLARLRRQVEEGKYILRSDFELELAARAAVFYAGLMQMAQQKAGKWIQLVEGNTKRIPDLIQAIKLSIEELLNEYATTREFHVLFQKDGSFTLR